MGQCASTAESASPNQMSSKRKEAPIEDVMAVVKLGAEDQGTSPGASDSNQNRLWAKKRVAVTAEGAVASQVCVVPKHERTKKLIADVIRDNLLFQDLPAAALEIIIDSMHSVNVAPGTDIIRQGDFPASEFYVLEDGCCEVWVKAHAAGKPSKCFTYTSGSAFGELALLYSSPRAASVRAASACKLWVMERGVYHAVKRNFTHEAFVARHKLLDGVPALKHLGAHHRALLVDALTSVDYKPGQAVFRKGDPGDAFYIVREGVAVVRDGAKELARLGPGQFFGERALLGAEVRAADVVADGRLVCYCLSRTDFDTLLGSKDEVWRYEALTNVPVLFNLSEQQLWQLARTMGEGRYRKGEVVFRQGDPGDFFYVVREGQFACVNDAGVQLAAVGPGGCFGELALLKRDARAATVVALSDAQVLTLSRDQFTALLGSLDHLRTVWRVEALRRVPLLRELSSKQLHHLAGVLAQVTVPEGHEVIRQHAAGDQFYIVEHGKLGAYVSTAGQPEPARPVMLYGPGSYFGELALLRNEPRAATVRALAPSTLLVLGRADFKALLGPLLPRMEKEADAYLSAVWQQGSSAAKELDMDQVHACAVLGAGGFGQVLLVRYKDGNHYALKCVAKSFVQDQGLVAHIKREKETMFACSSPFLVQLHGTSQDDHTLYMMMEAVLGGELFSYLQSRSRPLDESHARFYTASVVCALGYLHDRELVYRDLKPENLLIDLGGYVKMADFGFVKQVKKGSKTYTLCGTPEYLAPEVIMAKGHGPSADWWALGVLIWELVAGSPPFMDDDRLAMFKKACARQVAWPKHFSPTLRSLLDKLLEPNPLFRLGSGRGGAAEVRQHPWFAGFDWDAFEARRMPAPYVPKQPTTPGEPINFPSATKLNHVFRCKRTKPRTPFDDF